MFILVLLYVVIVIWTVTTRQPGPFETAVMWGSVPMVLIAVILLIRGVVRRRRDAETLAYAIRSSGLSRRQVRRLRKRAHIG